MAVTTASANDGDTCWPFVPKPALGEHVMGFARRLVEANGLDSMRPFWTTTGLTELTPVSSQPLWNRVRAITGLAPEYIDRMRWRPISEASSGLVSFMGFPVRRQFLVSKILRHCSVCMRAKPILQPSWSVYHVTACASHGAQLQDHCHVCSASLPLFSKTTIWDCRRCGTDLREAPASSASEPEVAFARLVEALFTGKSPDPSLHEDIVGLTLNQLLTTLERVGTIAATPAHQDQNTRRDRPRYSKGAVDKAGGIAAVGRTTSAAMSILQAWPHGYHDLLDSLVDRNPEPMQKNMLRRRFATELGLLAIQPILDHDYTQIEVITSELKRFCFQQLDYRWGQRKPSEPMVIELAPRRRRRKPNAAPVTTADYMSAAEAMSVLEGDPAARFAPWVEAGLLVPLPTATVRFSRSAVEELISQFEGLRSDGLPLAGVVSLIGAANSLAGRPYRKTHLIADVFSGRLQVFDQGSGTGISRFVIFKDDLTTCQAVLRLGGLVERGRYVQLTSINSLLEQIWGPMASFDVAEAQRWIATGQLRFRYETYVYGRRSFPRYKYHAGDLVRISQQMFRPVYFEPDERRQAPGRQT